MKRLPLLALALGIAPSLLGSVAFADDIPSVAAKLAPLTKGALPELVTTYGQVGSNSSGRLALMAPVQASVTNVFVRPGQPVKKGEKLVELTPSPGSLSAYEQAQSALNVAIDNVKRTRAMVASHLATQQTLLQAEQAQADAEANIKALNAQGARGARDITAPFNGIVTQVQVTPGDIVSEGSALAELVQPTGLMVIAGLVPSDAKNVKTGDPVTLTPIGGGDTIKGKVSFRGSFVDASSGLVPVDVDVNPNSVILGEMFRADIDVGNISGYVVPHHAVLVDDNGAPYVVQSDKLVAKIVSVRILASSANHDVVTGKLNPSWPLVIEGAYQMVDGTPIINSANSKGN